MFPELRQELNLFPVASDNNGTPCWSLQDPFRNLFFHIDWLTFEMLARWHLQSPERILEQIKDETPLTPDKEDFEHVLSFLLENNLLQQHNEQESQQLVNKVSPNRRSVISWLLHQYLFFRIPLWQPDAWLTRWQWLVTPIYSRAFMLLTFMALILGLFQVSRQWDLFTASLLDTFTLQGITTFIIVLICAKFVHELGHAFTAKRFGCKVPVMGVAFLVLFPMAYTDVNEAWKLSSKRQRLLIGGAGILTELYLAAWSTLLWSLLPAGSAKDAAFILASTTWISTLLINSSPFMRFDGYFLAMDWLEMPNLHQRATALGKWWLRERLFSLKDDAPESLSFARRRSILLFCFATWAYRLVIFIGIALLIYHALPKPLGPFLAAIELSWFIFLPIFREMKFWSSRTRQILSTPRTWLTLLFFSLLCLVAIMPWDQRIHSQGVLYPPQYQNIIAPGNAQIDRLYAAEGSYLKKGETLIELSSPNLNLYLSEQLQKADSLQWQLNAAGVNENLLEKRNALLAEHQHSITAIHGVKEELNKYRITSPFNGQFFPARKELKVGDWIGQNESIGTLIDTTQWQITSYLTASQLQRITLGDKGYFYSETPDSGRLEVEITQIDTDASRTLDEAMLASTRGGQLLVRESHQQLIPERSLYRITLKVLNAYKPTQPRSLRGQVVLIGEARAYTDDFIQSASALFIRESVF